MCIHIARFQLDGRFELAQRILFAAGVGVDNAQIEMSHGVRGAHLHHRFQQRPGILKTVHLNIRIGQVERGLVVSRNITELGLKLVSSLLRVTLRPQQVPQGEVHVRFLWIDLDSGAKFADGAVCILHLVQRFAHQHMGFCRLCVQRHNPVKRIEDTLVLVRQQTTMRQGQKQRKIPRITIRSLLQIGIRRHKLRKPIVRHADQNREPLRFVRVRLLCFEQRLELLKGLPVGACLEVRKP